MTSVQEQKLLKEARDRLKKAIDEDSENRKQALLDLEFIAVEGKQWPSGLRAERVGDDRPCLEINKMPVYIDQVVGDQRMNRPSIKVIPVDSKADPEVARVLGGWIKHVQQISKSDIAVDHAFEHAAACGYGAIRVVTKYVSDDSFDQEAFIEKIEDALAVYWGPHTEYDCSDALYCFLVYDMDRDEFKDKYKVEPLPFHESSDEYVAGWVTKDKVRLAEYFVKEPHKKIIYLLPNGEVADTVPEGITPVKKREVEGYKIRWYLLSGDKVLEERDWVGKKYIPVVPVWGKELNVGGKRVIRGLIRNAKDSQRMYNYWSSCDTEIVALAPKAPYLVTPAQISGHESMWKDANKKNYTYLLVNFDQKSPGWPRREIPPQASSAMTTKIAQADQDIRDTIGLQRASLGMPSNERSGAAIRERKMEGDVGTFAFVDNLARSVEHLGRILVDVAPGVLDTERIIRLGLEDGSQEFAAVNVEELASKKILNDLTVGVYDVVVTVGPSFTTQRTEARQSMGEFIQYYPAAAQIIGDLYAKAMDWPGAEEVSQRLEFLLPPEIKAEIAASRAEKAGTEVPSSSSAPAPPQPDPEEEAAMMEEQIRVQSAQIKLQEEQVKLQEALIKVEQEKAKLALLLQQGDLAAAQSKETVSKLIEEIIREESTDAGKESSATEADGDSIA